MEMCASFSWIQPYWKPTMSVRANILKFYQCYEWEWYWLQGMRALKFFQDCLGKSCSAAAFLWPATTTEVTLIKPMTWQMHPSIHPSIHLSINIYLQINATSTCDYVCLHACTQNTFMSVQSTICVWCVLPAGPHLCFYKSLEPAKWWARIGRCCGSGVWEYLGLPRLPNWIIPSDMTDLHNLVASFTASHSPGDEWHLQKIIFLLGCNKSYVKCSSAYTAMEARREERHPPSSLLYLSVMASLSPHLSHTQ